MSQQATDVLDDDLRLAEVALKRAAQRARELAAATDTEIVVYENGRIVHEKPDHERSTATNRFRKGSHDR